MTLHETPTILLFFRDFVLLTTFTRCRQSPLSPHRCSLRRHLAAALWDPDLANLGVNSPPSCPLCRSPSGASTANSQSLSQMFGKMKRRRRRSIKYGAKSRMNSSVKLTRSKRDSTRRSRRACRRPRMLSLTSTTLRPSSAPTRHWRKVRAFWPKGRNLLIKIADRSANGWGVYVVAEYTADELADDSDDEKRLKKAEKAAERKAGLKKRKRVYTTRGHASPGMRRTAVMHTRCSSSSTSIPDPAIILVPGVQALPLAHWLSGAVGPCFACGEMGHLRTYCPKMQSQEKKWYPSHMLMHEVQCK